MTNITITQVRSSISCSPKQKKALLALGLGRIGKKKKLMLNSSINGLIKITDHLIKKDYADK